MKRSALGPVMRRHHHRRRSGRSRHGGGASVARPQRLDPRKVRRRRRGLATALRSPPPAYRPRPLRPARLGDPEGLRPLSLARSRRRLSRGVRGKVCLETGLQCAVRAVRRDGRAWRAEAGENSQSPPIVVVATGWADYPYTPTWPGLETFGGLILHSSRYRNPAPFAGKRTLVIGYGNSGAEIALDLAEAGVDVALSVRSPVNIVPRELFGVPILVFPAAEQWLPPRVADTLNAPLVRFAIGSIETVGLKRSAKGAAPIHRGGPARAAHRRRHARCDARRTDQASRRRRELRARERRLQAVARRAL